MQLRGGGARARTGHHIVTRVACLGSPRFVGSGSQVGRGFTHYGRRSILELLSPRVGILERSGAVLMTNTILIGP